MTLIHACWKKVNFWPTVVLNDNGGNGGRFLNNCSNATTVVTYDGYTVSIGGRGDWAYKTFPTKEQTSMVDGWHVPCGTNMNESSVIGTTPMAHVPTLSQYTFGGYYMDKDFNSTGQFINASGVINSSCPDCNFSNLGAMVYPVLAKWTLNQGQNVGTWYTLTVDDRGATQGSDHNTLYMNTNPGGSCGGYKSIQSCYATTVTNNGIPTKVGYDYGGHYTGINGTGYMWASASGAIQYSITSNTTVYAYWIPKIFEITLNVNGGTGGSPAKICLQYGTNWTQYNTGTGKCTTTAITSITPPTRSNYTFQGYYNTSATSGGTQITSANGTLLMTSRLQMFLRNGKMA